MGRNIDADRLKKHYRWLEKTPQAYIREIMDEIVDAQPTVEPVEAEWEYDKPYKRWICSECGDNVPQWEEQYIDMDWHGHEYESVRLKPEFTPFCPWCGAKMKEKKDG